MSADPNLLSPAAAAPPTASTDPTPAPTPTQTFYQKQADDFVKALDEIAQILPKLEATHPATAKFVGSHLNVPLEFLATAIAAVEQTTELQAVKKLDVSAARDTLQFIEAFRPVHDKMAAFAKSLKDTMHARRANLAADALQIYSIAKGVARDPGASAVVSVVHNLKRDLGRRGRPRGVAAASKPVPAAASPGPIAPKEGWTPA